MSVLTGANTNGSATDEVVGGAEVVGEADKLGYEDLVRAFGEVALALRQLDDLQPLLQVVAENLCTLSGVARCSIFLRDEESGEFQGQVGYGKRSNDALVRKLTAGTGPDGFGKEILRTRKPVIVTNAQQDPRPIHATVRFWHIRSMLGVPMRLHDDVVGLVFLDTEDELAFFSKSTVDLASAFADLAAAAISQAQTTIKLRRTLSKVASQNKLLKQAASIEERLNALSVHGATLTEIADVVASLTSKPCAVYGDRFQLLAQAAPEWKEEGEDLMMPRPEFWRDRAVLDGISKMESGIGGILPPMPGAGLSHRCLLAPVVAGETNWGFIALMEQGGRFVPLDNQVLRRAAVSVSLEMSVERRASRLQRDAHSSLLGDLIRGLGPADSLEHRAAFLGLSLAQPRILALVAFRDPPEAPPAPADLSASLETRTGLSVFATNVTEGALLAIDLRHGEKSTDVIDEALREMIEELEEGEYTLLASTSTIVQGPEEYFRGYEEARHVLGCLQVIGESARSEILTAADLGAGRLLLASLAEDEARRYMRDLLGPLLQEDDQTKTLYHTVKVFLKVSCSFRRAARELAVHTNTVRYRLVKAEELTGLEIVDDGDAQFNLRVAMLIARISGLEPTEVVETTDQSAEQIETL